MWLIIRTKSLEVVKKTKTIIIPKNFVTTVFYRKHTRLVNGLKGLESEDTEDGFDEVSSCIKETRDLILSSDSI